MIVTRMSNDILKQTVILCVATLTKIFDIFLNLRHFLLRRLKLIYASTTSFNKYQLSLIDPRDGIVL